MVQRAAARDHAHAPPNQVRRAGHGERLDLQLYDCADYARVDFQYWMEDVYHFLCAEFLVRRDGFLGLSWFVLNLPLGFPHLWRIG